MKTFRFLFPIAIAGLLASCSEQDIQMRTVIHRDGSCQRVITFVADSATPVGGHDSPSTLHLEPPTPAGAVRGVTLCQRGWQGVVGLGRSCLGYQMPTCEE